MLGKQGVFFFFLCCCVPQLFLKITFRCRSSCLLPSFYTPHAHYFCPVSRHGPNDSNSKACPFGATSTVEDSFCYSNGTWAGGRSGLVALQQVSRGSTADTRARVCSLFGEQNRDKFYFYCCCCCGAVDLATAV